VLAIILAMVSFIFAHQPSWLKAEQVAVSGVGRLAMRYHGERALLTLRECELER